MSNRRRVGMGNEHEEYRVVQAQNNTREHRTRYRMDPAAQVAWEAKRDALRISDLSNPFATYVGPVARTQFTAQQLAAIQDRFNAGERSDVPETMQGAIEECFVQRLKTITGITLTVGRFKFFGDLGIITATLNDLIDAELISAWEE